MRHKKDIAARLRLAAGLQRMENNSQNLALPSVRHLVWGLLSSCGASKTSIKMVELNKMSWW